MTDIHPDPFSGLDHSSTAQEGSIKKDWRILTALLLVFVLSGLAVVYHVFLYRDSYMQLQAERKKREKLDEEWGRLLIEQQTFGAITQVGSSAVLRLQMYSPRSAEIVTLTERPIAGKPAPDAERPHE